MKLPFKIGTPTIFESSSRIVAATDHKRVFFKTLAQKLMKYSFTLSGKSVKQEGPETIMNTGKFEVPDTLVLNRTLTKNDLEKLKKTLGKLVSMIMIEHPVVKNSFEIENLHEISENIFKLIGHEMHLFLCNF